VFNVESFCPRRSLEFGRLITCCGALHGAEFLLSTCTDTELFILSTTGCLHIGDLGEVIVVMPGEDICEPCELAVEMAALARRGDDVAVYPSELITGLIAAIPRLCEDVVVEVLVTPFEAEAGEELITQDEGRCLCADDDCVIAEPRVLLCDLGVKRGDEINRCCCD